MDRWRFSVRYLCHSLVLWLTPTSCRSGDNNVQLLKVTDYAHQVFAPEKREK